MLFPDQIGKACLVEGAVIFADILTKVKLAKCPIASEDFYLSVTYERQCYPKSMRTPRLLPPKHFEYNCDDSEILSPPRSPEIGKKDTSNNELSTEGLQLQIDYS